MEDLKLVSIRPYKKTDIPYIYNSWLEDYLSSHFIKERNFKEPDKKKSKAVSVALMPKSIYYKEQRALIDKILLKSKVTVVCNEDDEDQIFGYVVHRFIGLELGVISWIYIRPIYRGMGLAKKLLSHIGEHTVVTHATPERRWFLRRFNFIYNPFMENSHD